MILILHINCSYNFAIAMEIDGEYPSKFCDLPILSAAATQLLVIAYLLIILSNVLIIN